MFFHGWATLGGSDWDVDNNLSWFLWKQNRMWGLAHSNHKFSSKISGSSGVLWWGCKLYSGAPFCWHVLQTDLSFIVAYLGAQQKLSANQPGMLVVTICDVMEPKLWDHGAIKCHRFTSWCHKMSNLLCGVTKCHKFTLWRHKVS